MALSTQYEKAKALFAKIENGEDVNMGEAIAEIVEAIEAVEKGSLFSNNEDLDDISTANLKYLELYYFLAKAHGNERDLSLRLRAIRRSMTHFEVFIQKMINFKIMSEAELEKMGLISADDRDEGSRNVLKQLRNNASSSAINVGSIGNSAASYSHSVGANTIDLEKKRVYKIMKFKKEQELKKRIMGLRRIISSTVGNSIKVSTYDKEAVTSPGSSGTVFTAAEAEAERVTSSTLGVSETRGVEEEESEYETEIREMEICVLQSYVLDSYDSISASMQEVGMLEHMDQLANDQADRQRMSKGAQYRAGGSSSSSSEPSQAEMMDERVDQLRRFGRELPDARAEAVEEYGPLEFTQVSKDATGELIMNRSNIKDEVFVPSFGAPTMSLDEFADREMARAMAAEEASKAPEGMVPTRRYSELYAAGEEDNEALVDEATLKDRDWDNWKDENKKGSGNKANKRF